MDREELKALCLWEKIQLVSQEVKNIEKNMTVGKGQYAYKAVSDFDVTLAVKNAEEKYRIVSFPHKQELVNTEVVRTVKDGDESLKFVDNIKMTMKIVNLDKPEEVEFIETFGKGVDPSDKGFGKASTYARKYGLLNLYKIATGEDPDAEKSKEINVAKTVSEKRKLVVDYLNLDNHVLTETLKHYSVAFVDDLSETQINQMYHTLKKKGKLS